jgi:hypothetical protein
MSSIAASGRDVTNRSWLGADSERWRAFLTDDEPSELAFFCPDCAELSSATSEPDAAGGHYRHPRAAGRAYRLAAGCPCRNGIIAARRCG